MDEGREKKSKIDEEPHVEQEAEIVSEADKIKKLKNELENCLKEKAEYLAGWQRAKADFINARKEEEKFREEFMHFACRDVIRELLPVADSFESAFNDREIWSKIDSKLREGIEQIHKQLIQIFEHYQVAAIETKDKEFNPAEHESVGETEVNDEKLDKIVTEEIQKGYKIHNQVLRPAKVKIGVYKRL